MPSTSGASNLSTTAPSPEPRGKILRFPTLNAESGVAAAGGAESAPVRRGLLAASSAVEESDSAFNVGKRRIFPRGSGEGAVVDRFDAPDVLGMAGVPRVPYVSIVSLTPVSLPVSPVLAC